MEYNITPLAFWEVMVEGKVPVEYLAQIPEELKGEWEPIVEQLRQNYNKICQEILEDRFLLPPTTLGEMASPEYRKTVGLFIKGNKEIKHHGAVFPLILRQYDVIDKYVMKVIRPKSNELISLTSE